MANREKGEVSVELDGASYVLCLDMPAMVALEDHFSKAGAEVTFGEIFAKVQRSSMRHVWAFLWASFLKHYPAMTLEDVNGLIQRSGGIFKVSEQLVGALAQAATPAPEDLQALGITPDPRKAQAKRKAGAAGTGPGFTSKRAASA